MAPVTSTVSPRLTGHRGALPNKLLKLTAAPLATCSVLPVARGDVPRARLWLPAAALISGCGRSLTAVRWADHTPMAAPDVQLRITIEPSPATGDHEVWFFGDDENLVKVFGDQSIGLDPMDVLVSPCPLIAEFASRKVLIARCDCGVIGCGDVHVNLVSTADVVTWSADHTPSIRRSFPAQSYHAEIARALNDHSWETPERTASRLLAELVDREALASVGLTFSWASGRANAGIFTVALWLEPGPYQVLVGVPPPDNLSPADLAKFTATLLRAAPATWMDVVWLPQANGLPTPSIAGPGWRRQ
jgi:hypothetical protein